MQYNYSNALFKQLNTSNALLIFSSSKYEIFYYNARSAEYEQQARSISCAKIML